MANEPFDIKKLLTSPFTLLFWIKSLMIGLGISMIIFISYGLWKAYIRKPEPSTNQSAEKIINYYNEPKATFGCATVRDFGRYRNQTLWQK